MTAIQMFRVAVKFIGMFLFYFALSSHSLVKIAFIDVHGKENKNDFSNHYLFFQF